MQNYKNIKKCLPGIQRDVSLAEYTSFRIGGPAEYFFEAKTKNDLIEAVKTAKSFNLPWFILGGGSNVLAADEGYGGLIVRIQNSKFKMQNDNSKFKIIEAESGTLLSKIVALATENNLTGLEWAAGIPGTVGGAIRGNAAAFGGAMADFAARVECFDSQSDKVFWLDNKDCCFGYRASIFKQSPHLVILSAEFALKKGEPALIQQTIRGHLEYRREHHPLNFPSAGSIFKNIKSPPTTFSRKSGGGQKLLKAFPELLGFNKKDEIPAGFLIDKCGLKGTTIGRAQISEKHANFIINLGGAKAGDVLALIELTKKKVKAKFGLTLEEEISLIC